MSKEQANAAPMILTPPVRDELQMKCITGLIREGFCILWVWCFASI